MSKNVSRRNFLVGAGALAVGTATGAAFAPQNSSAAQEMPTPPWPYVELDVEDVRKRGHKGFYNMDCAQGAFWAIISALAEKAGYPYTHMPTRVIDFGCGGVVGWGTLCGALNGSCAAISLIAKDHRKLCDEQLKWFTQTPLPTAKTNEYALNGQYLVEKLKYGKELAAVNPTSPLCHVTVTKWCEETGYASNAPERAERCARMTGDVAAHAVAMLNEYVAGQYEYKYDYIGDTNTCRSCHSFGQPYEMGGWTRGKMDCSGCHGENAIIVDMDHCGSK